MEAREAMKDKKYMIVQLKHACHFRNSLNYKHAV